jgi:hypothetical protein
LTGADGLQAGWRPLADGFEYILQLSPEAIDSLRAGDTLLHDIAPGFRELRSFRISAGTGPVMRLGEPLAPKPQPANLDPQPAAVEPAIEAEPPRPAPANRVGEHELPLLRPDENAAPIPGPHKHAAADVPTVKHAAYREPAGSASVEASPAAEPAREPAEPAAAGTQQPWHNLVLALLLFASLGGNAYLGWLAWGFRRRCQTLLQRRREAPRNLPPRTLELRPIHVPARDDEAEDDEDQDVRAVELPTH